MRTTHGEPSLGTGIYTYSEAAKLLHVSTAQVRGWAEGYVYLLNGEVKRREPVLQRAQTRPGLLVFGDLIELNFVREFRRAGVKLQDIRDSAKLLAERWLTPYPFAYRTLHTDGVQILLQAGEHYENVAHQQGVFSFIESFFRNIDFADGLAERWWPLGHEKLVVVDPHRSFGAPIEMESGIRTEVLYAAYKAEGDDSEAVADWYEIPRERVEAAVEFEEQWLRAA